MENGGNYSVPSINWNLSGRRPSQALRASSPKGGAKKATPVGLSLASPFKGRCPEGAERFVPLPDKSLFIRED